MTTTPESTTELSIIESTIGWIPLLCDRLTTDRADAPLFVAACVREWLSAHGVSSRIFFGRAAWILLMPDEMPVWAGLWEKAPYFWVETEFKETVDINACITHRRMLATSLEFQNAVPPPMLWSREVPKFFRFAPDGLAELPMDSEKERDLWERALAEMRDLKEKKPRLPNIPIVGPNRKVLDSEQGLFRRYDRALQIRGIPAAPF